jgi:flagellar biosynthetic protein FliR
VSLDLTFLFAFLAVFVRCTAMILVSPLYGNSVPVNVRVLSGAAISLAFVPVVQGSIGPSPTSVVELLLFVSREALFGVLIGACVNFLVMTVQAAGAFIDLQMGLASAQLFNPTMGGMATPIAQFKFMLGVVLVLLLNGHHLMFQALVQSYSLQGGGIPDSQAMLLGVVALLGQLMLLAIQIAAPVVAVTVVIDVAAGLVNKAVPQTVPFLLAMPAKSGLGMLALAIGLPGLVVLVQRGIEFTFSSLPQIMGGLGG